VPRDVIVRDGANNDTESPIRQFTPSESIYLSSRGNVRFSVGDQFSLVRPAKVFFRTTRYRGEHWTIHGLGRPYEDVGRVQVTHVTPEGAVAEVSFACEPIYPGDIAVPYQPRTIPDYVPTPLDRFPLPNGKIQGTIVAARNNFAAVRNGDIVYLNFGEKDGAKVGQRYRVYYSLPRGRWRWFSYPRQPRESVGEIVVLSTQEKSAAAIVVSDTRDINLGYGVELE
jgi:CRP-like cAMP-binding protein